MIPGLDLDSQAEQALWSAFGCWADHFRSQLAAGGLPSLLADYEELIRSLETQSCKHGPDGHRNTGEAWRSCCGISYEYLNDLSVRDALQVIIDSTPSDESDRVQNLVRPLDDRLKTQVFGPAGSQPSMTDVRDIGRAWWRTKLPAFIVP